MLGLKVIAPLIFIWDYFHREMVKETKGGGGGEEEEV